MKNSRWTKITPLRVPLRVETLDCYWHPWSFQCHSKMPPRCWRRSCCTACSGKIGHSTVWVHEYCGRGEVAGRTQGAQWNMGTTQHVWPGGKVHQAQNGKESCGLCWVVGTNGTPGLCKSLVGRRVCGLCSYLVQLWRADLQIRADDGVLGLLLCQSPVASKFGWNVTGESLWKGPWLLRVANMFWWFWIAMPPRCVAFGACTKCFEHMR